MNLGYKGLGSCPMSSFDKGRRAVNAMLAALGIVSGGLASFSIYLVAKRAQLKQSQGINPAGEAVAAGT